jgi:hypothetical protein
MLILEDSGLLVQTRVYFTLTFNLKELTSQDFCILVIQVSCMVI